MYRLYSFAGVTLPDARSEYQADTPSAVASMVAVAGGGSGFDTLGSAAAGLAAPYELRYRSVITAASLTALETAVAAQRALVGTRGTLRKRLASAATYYDVTARLLDVRMGIEPRHSHGNFLPVEWRFLVLDEFWRSSAAQTNGFTLNATPKACELTNSGNAPVRDVVVTFTPVGSDITVLEVEIAGVAHWQYTGTIAVGDELTVDCGARRVYNKALTDLYANFALESDHASEDWLPLAASATTTVNVTRTGGSTLSTASFLRYHKYV